MGDESKIRDAADAVRGVLEAAPIYEDALQPAAKQLGKALETVGKAVNVALAPLAGLIWGYEKIRDYLVPALEERLARVPPENIVTPNPAVAGPAIEALRFAAHDETLRDLYVNLLATSMDAETAEKAHPAFVEIIKQLSPDEAKLVSLMAKVPAVELAFVTLRAELDGTAQAVDVLRRFVSLGERAGCVHETLTDSYVTNLERLGLIETDDGSYYTGDEAEEVYKALEGHPRVQDNYKTVAAWDGRTPKFSRGLIRITALGRQFIEAAVVDRSSEMPVAAL